MSTVYQPLPTAELLEAWREGHAAGITVVTPNRRLAQAVSADFDALCMARGLTAWEPADAMSLSAWLERVYEDVRYSEHAAQVPDLLTAAQEQALWEQVIAASPWGAELLAVTAAARQCRAAWQLAHAWQLVDALERAAATDDTQAFAAWARSYAKTQRGVDAARLPALVAQWIVAGLVRPPRRVVAYGFDILTPQVRTLFDALAAAGAEVRSSGSERNSGDVIRRSFPSAGDELRAAASWARERLERTPAEQVSVNGPRIGIVVPALAQRRAEIARVFAQTLHPGWNLPDAARAAPPFNISLGVPLADEPMVHAALGWLAFGSGEVDFVIASRLLRSPFIGGANTEHEARALLDVRLRERLPARVSLGKLIAATDGRCPLLRARLEQFFAYARTHLGGAQPPDAWARHFSALLEALDFPGERALDSTEYQTRGKWQEGLAELAALERVLPRLNCAQAVQRLRDICRETLFQPETGNAPIQILGVLEAAGLAFDYLWVCGLTDDAWPLPAHPNPFIPISLQKRAGVPEATAESALALDRRFTEGWLHAAPEVVLSHPLRELDRELLPSPLIATLPLTDSTSAPASPLYREALFAARALESVVDGQAGAARSLDARGGTGVLADQAACPFRAFAHHRLAARALEMPAASLDARARGTLMHALMATLWGELGSQARLAAITAAELDGVIFRAANAALARLRDTRPDLLDGRFGELEQARLIALAHEWLAVERRRAPFEVVAREERRAIDAGGLRLSGRIDRLDRLADGSYALLDYKISRDLSLAQWHGERPDDPQLPAYATSAPEQIRALAYARVRIGATAFVGYTQDPAALPGSKPLTVWPAQLAEWRQHLSVLGRSFLAGDARVAPKNGLKTCQRCDLHPLCRVHERLGPDADDAAEYDE